MQTVQQPFSFLSLLDGSIINEGAVEKSYEAFLAEHKRSQVLEARKALSTYDGKQFYQIVLDAVPDNFGDFEGIKQASLNHLEQFSDKMQRHPFDSSDICAMLGTLAGAGLVETHEELHYRGEYCTGNTLTYKRLVAPNYII